MEIKILFICFLFPIFDKVYKEMNEIIYNFIGIQISLISEHLFKVSRWYF